MCWERYWSMERCVGTGTGVWIGVLGPVLECGAVCWDRYWSMERCVGTGIRVWSGDLGPYREGQVSAYIGFKRQRLNLQIV